MAQLGWVSGRNRHPKDDEITYAVETAKRSRPASQPRLFLGVLNESGELYRYITLDGYPQGRLLKDRLRELGLTSDADPGVIRMLGTL